jgi:low affinity Fe/Cu permease
MTATTAHDYHHSPANGSPTLARRFSHFAQAIAFWTGHPTAFLLALAVIAVWIVSGPIFHYSDTWQLVINTGTTIVTFLMVFLIQNTQNRDIMAVQLKLSELVLGMKGAENKFASIEDLTDEELQALHDDFRARADLTREHIEHRHTHGHRRQKPHVAAQGAKSHRRTAPQSAKS